MQRIYLQFKACCIISKKLQKFSYNSVNVVTYHVACLKAWKTKNTLTCYCILKTANTNQTKYACSRLTSEITNHNDSVRSSCFYLQELVNSSCFSLWSFVKIHPQKIFIYTPLLQKLNLQKPVTQILSSKHLITTPHTQVVFHVSKIKIGT